MEEAPTIRFPRVLVALFWWTIICCLAAAPSFVLGLQIENTIGGMLAGVATFILGYTLVSFTPPAQRLYANRVWRRTIHITYGTRIAFSLLSILALIGVPFVMMIDIWAGLMATVAAERLVGDDAGFWFAYLATLIEGAILNFILFVYMMMVWAIARKFMEPDEPLHRGFDVIPISDTP